MSYCITSEIGPCFCPKLRVRYCALCEDWICRAAYNLHWRSVHYTKGDILRRNHIAHRDLAYWIRHFESGIRRYSQPCPRGANPIMWESMKMAHMDMVDDLRRSLARQRGASELYTQSTMFTLSDTPLDI